jgi:ATP-binding cassette, subfamily C, bacterial CydD
MTLDAAQVGEGPLPVPAAAVEAGTGPGRGEWSAQRWLAAQARPAHRLFVVAGIADSLGTVGTVIGGWYAAALIVAGVRGTSAGYLVGAVIGVAAGGALRAAGGWSADRLAATGAQRVEAALRDRILETLVLTDPACGPVDSGAAAGVVEQLAKLGEHFHGYYRMSIATLVAPVVILAAIFPASWIVAVLLLLATPIVPVNMAVTGLRAEAVSRQQLAQVERLSSQVLERLQAMSTLRALGAVGQQRRVVERAASELARRTTSVLRIAFLASSTLEWVSTFAIGIAAMYVGATLLGYVQIPLLPSRISPRVGVFVLLLAPAYFQPLRRFAAAYHQRQEALAASDMLAPLSDGAAVQPTVRLALGATTVGAEQTAYTGIRIWTGAAPSVRLRSAGVCYQARQEPALEAADLFVPAGGVLGVAGPSGAGKSTLLAVAGGWLVPTDGQALLDGVPASKGCRALVVGQHPYLFSGTLANNLGFGRQDLERDRMEEALADAQLTDLLRRLPDGLDTVLGERGWGISGGEAQRLALARALLSDASLVVLDEPTAHLDAATEAAVLEPLARFLQGRTALIASHSNGVLAIADDVVELEGGHIRG